MTITHGEALDEGLSAVTDSRCAAKTITLAIAMLRGRHVVGSAGAVVIGKRANSL